MFFFILFFAAKCYQLCVEQKTGGELTGRKMSRETTEEEEEEMLLFTSI